MFRDPHSLVRQGAPSNDRPRPWIGYIVLPPGHGKSYRHNPQKSILEADTLVPCRSTTILENLRSEAKQIGDWSLDDQEWAIQLASCIPDRRVLLMVPSEEVGMALNGTFLGASVLTESAWEKNFHSRTDSMDKHRKCWSHAAAISVTIHESNESLSGWVDEIADMWIIKHNESLLELK